MRVDTGSTSLWYKTSYSTWEEFKRLGRSSISGSRQHGGTLFLWMVMGWIHTAVYKLIYTDAWLHSPYSAHIVIVFPFQFEVIECIIYWGMLQKSGFAFLKTPVCMQSSSGWKWQGWGIRRLCWLGVQFNAHFCFLIIVFQCNIGWSLDPYQIWDPCQFYSVGVGEHLKW